MQMNKQGTLSCRNVLLLQDSHQSSHNRGLGGFLASYRMFSSKNPDNSHKAHAFSPYIPPTLCVSITFMMSLNDVTIICFPPLMGKTLHMHRRATPSHLHICWHPHWSILMFPTAMHGPSCQFCIPNSEPVTHISMHDYYLKYLSHKKTKNSLTFLLSLFLCFVSSFSSSMFQIHIMQWSWSWHSNN